VSRLRVRDPNHVLMAATMAEAGDYYETLGVEASATNQQIIDAYRKMAFRYHPDLHPGDEKASARFKAITEAFEVLSNPDKRRTYDERGKRRDEPDTFEEKLAKKATAESPSRVSKGASFADLFGRTNKPGGSSGTSGGFGDMFGRKPSK
jgi:DnaJ-class molecular chaperone